jgi:hypothetical protein
MKRPSKVQKEPHSMKLHMFVNSDEFHIETDDAIDTYEWMAEHVMPLVEKMSARFGEPALSHAGLTLTKPPTATIEAIDHAETGSDD